MISASISSLSADVASSRINNFGSLYSALAIPTLCFCPPDIFIPLSPIIVLSLSF